MCKGRWREVAVFPIVDTSVPNIRDTLMSRKV